MTKNAADQAQAGEAECGGWVCARVGSGERPEVKITRVCSSSPVCFSASKSLAVGETVILLTPPSPSLLKHLLKGEEDAANDRLADG